MNYMKNDEKILGKIDIIFLVITAGLTIVASVALCALPKMIPLYAGMLGVFVYMLILAGYLAIRMKRSKPTKDSSEMMTFGGDLTSVLSESSHPTLLVNANGVIVWCNRAFLDAVGSSEIEPGTVMENVCPKVTECALSDKVSHLCSIGEELYQYDFAHMPDNPSCFLVTFRNVTMLNRLQSEMNLLKIRYDEDRTAVAYVVIDNIEDLLQHIQDKFRSAANEVAALLRDWAASMGAILRSYDRDKFILLFDKRHLEECVNNRFAILDRIRNVRVGDGVPVTVSIGVSCATGTLFEKEQLAQGALDMALQRGGDQVVYKNDTGTDYFGGKTKAIYKRANVRARAVGLRILDLLAHADNVLIMGHAYGDYDSFGSAIGMARLSMCYGVSETHIVCNRNDKNLSACFDKILGCEEYEDVFISADEALRMVTEGTLLIVVDVNNFPHAECPKLFDVVKDVVIIDHHTQSNVFNREINLAYIEPSASSASEMVAEILEQFLGAKRLLKEEAELMLSGILLDTKQLIHNTGTRTFGAALFLRGEGADPGETNEFFKNDVYDLVKQSQFLTNVVVYKEILAIAVCEGDTDASYRVVAAKAADRLLTGRGIVASFAIVTINGKVHISARSNGTVNVAKILEELHGGGHFDSAGAQIEEDAKEETIEKLKHAIDKYVA